MTRRQLLLLTLALTIVAGLTALWRCTPLANSFSLNVLTTWALEFNHGPAAWLWSIAAFVIAGQVFFPITLLNLAAVLAFGAVLGTFYSIVGSLAAGVVTYAIGRMIGEAKVCDISGSRLQSVRREIKKHGLATSITVHILPMAPFTLVNLLSGACGVRLRDFILGTFIGQLPGAASVLLFERQLVKAVKSPDVTNITLLGLVIVALSAITVWLQRYTAKRDAGRPAELA